MKVKVFDNCEPVDEKFVISVGIRICRIIITKHKKAEWEDIPNPGKKGRES